MIELKNISKSFGEHHVLKNVSAKFHKGKVNFIIGRSGSGKSVMTKCTEFRPLQIKSGLIDSFFSEV